MKGKLKVGVIEMLGWGRGGEADKNGMSNFIFSPTFYFAPPPLY